VEPLRAYLLRMLRTTDPDEVIHRIASRLLARLEADALTVGDVDDAARDLQRSGQFYRLCDLVEVTLGCPEVLLDSYWTGPLERRRAVALFRRGRSDEAILAAESARDAFRAEHDAIGLSRVQSDLGTFLGSLYRWPECIRAFRLAVTWAQEAGNERLEAKAEFNGAIAAHKMGRWRETLATLIRIRGYVRTIDVRNAEVDATSTDHAQFLTNYLVEVAQTFRHLGFPRKAIEVAREAERVASRFGIPRNRILALAVIGEAQLDLRRVNRARTIFTAVRREAVELAPGGDLAVSAFRQLAEVHLARGDFELARRMVRCGLLHAEKQTDHTEWIRLVRVDGRLLIEQGRPGAGVERIREAIARARQQRSRSGAARPRAGGRSTSAERG